MSFNFNFKFSSFKMIYLFYSELFFSKIYNIIQNLVTFIFKIKIEFEIIKIVFEFIIFLSFV